MSKKNNKTVQNYEKIPSVVNSGGSNVSINISLRRKEHLNYMNYN